jgi:hypothetical protein
MTRTSDEKRLLNRGWKKLTPSQARRFAKNDCVIALKVVGSMLYELQILNGNTYIRRF